MAYNEGNLDVYVVRTVSQVGFFLSAVKFRRPFFFGNGRVATAMCHLEGL